MSASRAAALLSGVLGLLFVAALVATATGRMWALDHGVAEGFDGHHVHAADVLFAAVALTASVAVSGLWALGVLLAAWRSASRRAIAVTGIVALALTQVVEVVLKTVLDHPGPRPVRYTLPLPFLGTSPETAGSFPSGHVLRAVVLAATTALLVSRGRRTSVLAMAAIYVALVVWTRLYLGEHWASDVVGAMLLALALVPPLAVVAARSRVAPS